VGSPLDTDWPGDHFNYWTRIIVPEFPDAGDGTQR
jgi:hypothetical protein